MSNQVRVSNAMQVKAVLTACCFLLTVVLTGCFDTYRFSPEEFRKLQTPEQVPRTVSSVENEKVIVERGTSTYVRSKGGRRYPVTAFNFKMTRSQLVASDRDTLLALSDLQSYEVDLLSTWKTATLIALGVAVAGGLITLSVIQSQSND